MSTASHPVDDDRRVELGAFRAVCLDLRAKTEVELSKTVAMSAGGLLALTATVVGMLVAGDAGVPVLPLVLASLGFGGALLAVVQSHVLSARALSRQVRAVDRELEGRGCVAPPRNNVWVDAANRGSVALLAVGVVGLISLLLAASGGSPRPMPPNPDDGKQGITAPYPTRPITRPAPAPPKPQDAPKPK